jgi:putrescine---pyruvate transaminase
VPGYWQRVQELCQAHDVLLIADEVICGFGRLGTWFGCHRFGITPDLITCAKGITSGYLPLGAVIAAPRVQEPFWTTPGAGMFRHGYTYSGHPSVCAAGLANLEILEREGLLERVLRLEPVLAEAMAPLTDLPLVSQVRSGVGLLAAVEIDAEARAADPGLVDRVVRGCRDRGVLTRGLAGHSLQVSPSFVVDEDEISRVAAVFAETLSGVSVGSGV